MGAMEKLDPRFARFLSNERAAAAVVAAAERADTPARKTALLPVCTSLLVEEMELEQKGTDASGAPTWQGPCPACRAAGSDSDGGHFVLFSDGAWACVANKGEAGKEHRSQIRKIVGSPRGIQPAGPRLHPIELRRLKVEKERADAENLQNLKACRVVWDEICEFARECAGDDLATCISKMLGESGPVPEFGLAQFRFFCSFFAEGEWAWCGEMRASASLFRSRSFEPKKAVSVMQRWALLESEANLSEVCFLASFAEDAGSREEIGVTRVCGGVVEHDGPKGQRTPVWQQVALLAWLRDAAGLDLRAVLGTGGKGCHGWLDASALSAMLIIPGAVSPIPLVDFLRYIGADAQAFSRAATRIPGVVRPCTERSQEILWTKKDEEKPCQNSEPA